MRTFTIRDIAQKAGVSVSTVSRVLNNRPDVNEKTRGQVMAVINKYHFVCNANAKNLKQHEARVVGVIVRGHSNPFLNDITEHILRYGAKTDINFLVEYIDEKDDEFQTAQRMFVEKRALGFILVGSRIDTRGAIIEKLKAPFVFTTVDASLSGFKNASSVAIDDRAMGRRAIEYLLDAGHQKIAVFGGCVDGGDSLAQRYRGAMDAFEARGIPFDARHYVETRFSIEDAYEAAKAYFLAHTDDTAVFAMSDQVAFGVVRALKDLNKRVPQDVSVFGFDGIEMGRYAVPSITTIEQPVDEMAKESVNVLLSMTNGEEPSYVRLDAKLIERESVAPLGAKFM